MQKDGGGGEGGIASPLSQPDSLTLCEQRKQEEKKRRKWDFQQFFHTVPLFQLLGEVTFFLATLHQKHISQINEISLY